MKILKNNNNIIEMKIFKKNNTVWVRYRLLLLFTLDKI